MLLFLFCIFIEINVWPIPNTKTAQNTPSIELRLAPPADPLPQVGASIRLLERERIRVEEVMMAKLEDEFNKQLSKGSEDIKELIPKSLKAFKDKNMLKNTVKTLAKPLKSDFGGRTQMAGGFPKFMEIEEDEEILKDGPIDMQTYQEISKLSTNPQKYSFLQSKSIPGNLMKKLANAANPSVKVELVTPEELDTVIEDKLKQMESQRSSEEQNFFKIAFKSLTKVRLLTKKELTENIQLQMNAYLADRDGITSVLTSELGAPTGLSNTNPNGNSPLTGSFRQENHNISFLQSNPLSKALNMAADQLNIKLAVSDEPYPTVEDLMNRSLEKREATERLEKSKVLELDMKLMSAFEEIIKSELHTGVAEIIALLGNVSSSMKEATLDKQFQP